jgi:hypothetical protein
VTGNHLAVANCAVGAADHNFCYYVVDPLFVAAIPTLPIQPGRRSHSSSALQLHIAWCLYDEGGSGVAGVLASTEERYLWLVRVEVGGTMSVVGNQKITSQLRWAIARSALGQLAVSAYDLSSSNWP